MKNIDTKLRSDKLLTSMALFFSEMSTKVVFMQTIWYELVELESLRDQKKRIQAQNELGVIDSDLNAEVLRLTSDCVAKACELRLLYVSFVEALNQFPSLTPALKVLLDRLDADFITDFRTKGLV